MEENFENVSDCLHSPASLGSMTDLEEDTRDRVSGMIAGNIIGDMLGVSLMGDEGRISPVRPLVLEGNIINEISGGGFFGLDAGDWTDDTSLLIALAESLHETGGNADPANELKHYRKWLMEGAYTPAGDVIDAGRVTREAVQSGEPRKDRESNGNGSLMRSSVLTAAYLRRSDASLIDASGLSCSVTHAHPVAKFTNVIYNLILKRLIYGSSLRDALGEMEVVYRHMIGDLEDIFVPPEAYDSSGYCVNTLGNALWINIESSSFEEAVLKSVNLGGDSDTLGAVAGAVAGAVYGVGAVPERWLSFIDERITRYAGIASYLKI
ncbi:ADP-ribosylglycohydrolase family protein [Limisalsivibrio acetivorans]|uniref:ADP-ribosylglycohydrolase family protein n=1 Tax=Limisalsivibrio acetivorans TaxID=1304888 RepID=UPI0003B6AFF7|nr:ADP-ribosylglycohydrolase family protein [Limisalsivibrio acetivorans]